MLLHTSSPHLSTFTACNGSDMYRRHEDDIAACCPMSKDDNMGAHVRICLLLEVHILQVYYPASQEDLASMFWHLAQLPDVRQMMLFASWL